jgi:hypothetical protein
MKALTPESITEFVNKAGPRSYRDGDTDLYLRVERIGKAAWALSYAYDERTKRHRWFNLGDYAHLNLEAARERAAQGIEYHLRMRRQDELACNFGHALKRMVGHILWTLGHDRMPYVHDLLEELQRAAWYCEQLEEAHGKTGARRIANGKIADALLSVEAGGNLKFGEGWDALFRPVLRAVETTLGTGSLQYANDDLAEINKLINGNDVEAHTGDNHDTQA